MKLFFKFLICFYISNIEAREVILVTFNQQKELAKLIRKIIVEQSNIPMELFNMYQSKNPCIADKQAILHVCVSDQGKTKIIVYKKDILSKTFKPFLSER